VRRFAILFATLAFGGSAFAADMATKMPVKAPPPPPAPVYSWTGFYIGGDLGGAWTSNTGTWTPLQGPVGAFPINVISGSNKGSSFLGGLHAGYNYQFAPAWVAGLEGDWTSTHAKGSFTAPWVGTPAGPVFPSSGTTMSSTLDWVSSIRGRFGYLVTPNILAYATGGVAWAKFDYAGSGSCFTFGCAPGIVYNITPSSTQTGYTVGGGLEWAMTKNWLVRAEYLYYHFSSGLNVIAPDIAPVAFNPSNFSWNATNISVGRVGLSYKF